MIKLYRSMALFVLTVAVTISTGCSSTGKEAGEAASKGLTDLANKIEKSSENMVKAAEKIDPMAINRLIDMTEKLHVEVEALRKENQDLTEQLQGKVPVEAVGTYKVSDPSLPGATAKVALLGGNQFLFERSDGLKQTFVWDKAQQCFIGPDTSDRAYFFGHKGVLAFETQSFWYR